MDALGCAVMVVIRVCPVASPAALHTCCAAVRRLPRPSDVWSYAVLCTEICTLGDSPFPGQSAKTFIEDLRNGVRPVQGSVRVAHKHLWRLCLTWVLPYKAAHHGINTSSGSALYGYRGPWSGPQL